MNLPERIYWPDSAVTFLLIGGQDNFRGSASVEEYIAETRAWVPRGNGTTAILYVNEMVHMPQGALLRAVLPAMLCSLLAWKPGTGPPKADFRKILSVVNTDGWSGRLMYTKRAGEWATDVDFGPFHVARHKAPQVPVEVHIECRPSVEMTKGEELKELFRAAGTAAKPGGGVPMASVGARFHAAAQAAAAAKAQLGASRPAPPMDESLSPKKSRLALPIAPAGAACEKSPCGSPSRLPVPRGGRPYCEATPIMRALGMGRFATPSPSHAGSTPSPSPQHHPSPQHQLSPQHHVPPVRLF